MLFDGLFCVLLNYAEEWVVHVNTTKTKFMSGLTCLSVKCASTIVFRALVQQHDVWSAAGVCQEDVQHDALPLFKTTNDERGGTEGMWCVHSNCAC